MLSLDLSVQDTVHRILGENIKKFKATGGTSIVMDVNTGEVLASVSLPDYNPNLTAVVDEDAPVFKVQFLSSAKKLSKGSQAFKGLTPVDCYYDKGLYKYTYGASTDYNKILRLKRKVNEKFKDAFIVAFVKGERIDTKKAIAQFQKNNP
jgi:N-acetylmuramoyl-L-alanine amidase